MGLFGSSLTHRKPVDIFLGGRERWRIRMSEIVFDTEFETSGRWIFLFRRQRWCFDGLCFENGNVKKTSNVVQLYYYYKTDQN